MPELLGWSDDARDRLIDWGSANFDALGPPNPRTMPPDRASWRWPPTRTSSPKRSSPRARWPQESSTPPHEATSNRAKQAARTAGIEANLGTNAGLRTVVTSLFVDGHEALEDIARFVGHAKPSTTAGYVKRLGRRPEAVARRAVEVLDAHAEEMHNPSSVIRWSCHPNERLRIHPGLATLIAFWSAATRSHGLHHPADSTSSRKANLQLLVQLADKPWACPAVVTVAAEVPR